MKGKKNMKKYIKKLLIPILFVLLVIIFLPQKLFVTHAQTQEFDETFFSKANTYDAIITKEMIQTDTDFITYDSIRYDTYSRNSNQVSDEDPQVTFITHGLNGKASHWSNVNEVLTPTKNSIIDILTQMTDCNIYLAVFTNWNFFELFQLEDDNYSFMDKEPLDNNKILDNSKHSIVLFQAFYPDQTNDFIYTQFNILVSSILLDLQELDPENELPRINLIGHSRGGITNLQYALDHPQIVDSIFSLGTPYLGSTMASIDNFILGGLFTGNSAGEDDITNPDIYLGYLNRWNRDYDLLYSNINVHAIGAYSSLDTLLYQLIYYIFHNYLKINDPKLELEIQILLKAVNLYLSRKLIALKIVDKLSPTLKQELASGILNIVFRKYPEILLQTGILQGLISILNLIFDELNFNVVALSYDFLNDFLVDLPSQLGYDGQSINEYKGFKQHKKRFSILSNFDLSKTSVNHVPVLHNLETRDTGLLLYIAKNISLSGNLKGTPYITSIIDEESVAITGYVGKNVEGQLAIPEVVYREDGDGNPNNNLKKVVEIGDNAFSDNMQGSNTITSVVIPKTVKRVGKNAFYNNEYLQSISFSQDSELEIIEEGAFSYIPQLTSFTIPSFVHQIGERAFEGSGISSMIGNNNYIWNSNLLIQQNVSDPSNLIALYANPNAQSITIPENVKILSAYLFKNNQNLTSIDLNQTQYIGYEAFNNSNLTTIINSNNVKEAGIDAFIGTKWLDNQTSDIITLGKVLIECKTNQQQLIIPEGIVSIGENCMVENTATSIILPSTLEVIGQSAFLFNSNLQWVLLNSTNPPILSDNSFGEDVIFYVKGIALNTYQNNIYYQDLPNQIKTK